MLLLFAFILFYFRYFNHLSNTHLPGPGSALITVPPLSSPQMVSKDMEDVKIEFSPIYWIENGTLVPTTTTTTTTTTSTTEATTTFEPVPITNTPIDGFGNRPGAGDGDDMMSNEIDRSSQEEIVSIRNIDKPESSISLSSIGGSSSGSKGGAGGSGAVSRWTSSGRAIAVTTACLLLAAVAQRI